MENTVENNTKYKLCNIDVLNSNFNICKVNKNNEIEKIKYVCKKVSRTGLTKYNVYLIEDRDAYLMVNRNIDLYHYYFHNDECYKTSGVVITIDMNCNELLNKENRVKYIDYFVFNNKEVKSLIELIDKVKISTNIYDIIENYNNIKFYIEVKVTEIKGNRYMSYNVRKNMYKLIKYNLCSDVISKKYIDYKRMYFTSMKYIYNYMKNFNDRFYIIINDDNIKEVYSKKDNSLIGYILDNMLVTFDKFDTDSQLGIVSNISDEDNDYVKIEEE